jgi:uncharacterized Zn-binding protein involved in type VI secretion
MPAVCRGDLVDADVVHCSQPKRLEKSPDVFVNSIGVSRQGDKNDSHLLPGVPCPTHQAPITTGSTRVFANNKGIGRIGDGVTSCTKVATGSSDTFDGSP